MWTGFKTSNALKVNIEGENNGNHKANGGSAKPETKKIVVRRKPESVIE